jgi:hypothetical protein
LSTISNPTRAVINYLHRRGEPNLAESVQNMHTTVFAVMHLAADTSGDEATLTQRLNKIRDLAATGLGLEDAS